MFFIMKTTMVALVIIGLASAALAIEPAQLNDRIRQLTAKFEMLQARPDKAIPPDVLRRARGIILLDRTKAGFLFAYEGGGGVAMVRDPRTDKWSPAAFMGASDASLGLQIGGEQDFFAILLMDRDATRFLTEPNYKFGGEATGTAGQISGKESASVPQKPVLVYDTRNGLYGGAVVKGGSITQDDKANRIYYGQYLTPQQILFEHVVPPSEAAQDLALKLNNYSAVPVAPESPEARR
jgi:lipid-binding SYLF domain-containing protein